MGLSGLNLSAPDLPDFDSVRNDPDLQPHAEEIQEQSEEILEEDEIQHPKPKEKKLATPQSHTPSLTGVIRAADLLDQEYVILDLGPYRKYFGSVSNNFDAMFHGQPGAGKTHFLIQFANWLAENVGNTAYISSEEVGYFTDANAETKLGSVTLRKTIKNTIGKAHPNLYLAKDLKDIDLNEFKAVFLDSVNHIGIDINSYKALRQKYPDQIFILILQKTKSGQFKGGKDWEHEIDIAGEFRFEKGTGKRVLDITSKNRFGTLGEYLLN